MKASILIVNYNGRSLLPDCLAALSAQTLPREQYEIVMVDNGSADDSIAYVMEAYPAVRIVEAGSNLGFAGGNNLAARHAKGEWLALINNDAIADEGWLERLLAAAERESVLCVAGKMLNPDGSKIDFSGGVMNLWGRAFAPQEGWQHDPATDPPRALFFACGGAMLIQRECFLAMGGFDEHFIAYFEDVDLGWRLQLAGQQVWYEPTATVRHLGSTTGKRFPVEQRYTLSEGNALRALIQNYEEATLNKVLPLSLLLMAQRALQQGGVARESYRFGVHRSDAEPMGDESEPAMSRIATGMVVAMAEIADDLPRIMARRREVQAGRTITDEALFYRFPLRVENFLFPWRETVLTQERLMNALEISAPLRPVYGNHLLIITHERIGERMAGPAIRAWEIAHALAEEFDVALACYGTPQRESQKVRLLPYEASTPNNRELGQYIAGADVVLAMGTLVSRFPILQGLNKPLIVDLYDPFELEKLAQFHTLAPAFRAGVDEESVRDVAMMSRAGDFYICASERQRDLWLGLLLGAGRLNQYTYAQDSNLRALIDVVPFGVPDAPPAHPAPVLKGVHPKIHANDKLLLWGGGLWEWFDPLSLLEAVAVVIQSRPDVKLFFAAGAHFDATVVPSMPILAQVRERAEQLGLLEKHVFFGDWIPYDERGAYLVEADIGVSTHKPGIESRYASRTRLLDYVWAGLPILTTSGDPIAEEVTRRGGGIVVPPHDVPAIVTAIHALLAEGQRESINEAVFAPWREEIQWRRVVAPIIRFLKSPRLAPDASQALGEVRTLERLNATNQQLKSHIGALELQLAELKTIQSEASRHIAELEAHITAIENGRLMKLLNKLKR